MEFQFSPFNVCFLCVLLLAFLGNMALLIKTWKKKLFNNIVDILIFHLALTDLLLVVSAAAIDLVIETLGYFPYGSIGCKFCYPFQTYLLALGTLTLLAMSYERYNIVLSKSRLFMSKRKVMFVVMMIHVPSLLSVIPYVITLKFTMVNETIPTNKTEFLSPVNGGDCIETLNLTASQMYTIALFLIQYAIPIPSMLVLYYKAWKSVQKANKSFIEMVESASYKVTCSENSRKSSQTVGERRLKQTADLFKTFTATAVIFVSCLLPHQIYWILLSFGLIDENDVLIKISHILTYSNPLFNPLIYGRFKLKKTFKRCKECLTS